MDNVQIRFDKKYFHYEYKNVLFLKRLQSSLTNAQLAANFYNAAHSLQAGMQDPTVSVTQTGKDSREICISPSVNIHQFLDNVEKVWGRLQHPIVASLLLQLMTRCT